MSDESEENITIGSPHFSDITGSTLQTGDITTTITAGGDIVGRDKIVHNTTQIIQQALSAVEEAEKANSAAQERLAKGVRNYVQRLQEIAMDDKDADAGGPYKGLLAYRLNDAELFFGRQHAVTDLLRCLQRGPLTVLHSESGAGKSSLLEAGISPYLIAQGHLPIYLRPYNLPPGLALKRALVPGLEATPELAAAPLQEFLRRVMEVLDHKTTLYLLVDQFEEVFTLLPEIERAGFAGELANCLKDPTLKVCWVLALRSEFFSDLANFRPQIENPFQNEYRLNRLTQAEARQVIIAPAQRQGIAFEPAVVEALLAELHDEKGELSPPQIQLVCSALYNLMLHRQAESPGQPLIMTQALYEAGGRAEGILRGYLNRVLRNNLPTKQERDLARRVLTALVSANQRRLRRTRSDLAAQLAIGITTAQNLDSLLEQLVKSRLLSVEKDEETDEASYELIHDYLLTEIEISPEEQTRKAAAELLKQEVETYKRYNTLLDPKKYDIINSQREFLGLDDTGEELLRLSKEAIEAGQREKEAQRRRELEVAQKLAAEAEARRQAEAQRAEEQTLAADRLRKRAIWLAAIGIVATFMAITTVWFYQQAEARHLEAEEQLHLSTSRELAAAALNNLSLDPELSILLALQALSTVYTPQAEDALHQAVATSRVQLTLSNHQAEVNDVAFSPDGLRLVTAGWDGTARVWDAMSGTNLFTLTGHSDRVYGIAVSLDGNHLATASRDKTAKLWDINSGQMLLTFSGHDDTVNRVAFSPDGLRLATASWDGTAKVWDIVSGRELFTLAGHTNRVWGVAFSPDGKHLVTASQDRTVKVWDAATGQELFTLAGHKDTINDIAFSPDGRHLATASWDGTVKIWGTTTWQVLLTLTGHTNQVRDVAFSPDGSRLTTASRDRTAKVWEVVSGRELFTLAGHKSWIKGVAFSPDGTRLATASEDGSAKVWNAAFSRELFTLTGHTEQVYQVVFSPNGMQLATASGDGTVKVWDATSGEALLTHSGHHGAVRDVAFSPDGMYLATASEDRTAKIRDAALGRELLTLVGHRVPVLGVTYSPDGTRVATTSSDETARVWDVASGKELLTLSGHTSRVNNVAFDPSGTRLATSSGDGTAMVWDAVSGERIYTLRGHTAEVAQVVFSPDGSRLATSSWDRTTKIWDAKTGDELMTLFDEADIVWDVDFNPDGSRLATASGEIVKVWDALSGDELLTLSGHKGWIWSGSPIRRLADNEQFDRHANTDLYPIGNSRTNPYTNANLITGTGLCRDTSPKGN